MINIKKEIETGIKNFDVLKVEKILNEELNKDKENIDLLLKLSVVELWTPDEDYDKSLEYINRVYKIDNDNIDALIMECSIYNIYFGGVNDRLLNKLAKINIDNKRIMSILKYLMSFIIIKI